MENVPYRDTAIHGVNDCSDVSFDTIILGRNTRAECLASTSDPLLDLLPSEGYRVLISTPESTEQLTKSARERADSYISFQSIGFDNRDEKYASRFALPVQFILRNASHLLLIFVPIGIVAPEIGCNDSVVFVLNCLAIIPLASLLCRATEDVSSHLGATKGALLNVTVGNITEMAIFHALSQQQYTIVRTSLLGSIVVNMLLALGLSMLAGEIQMRGQVYNVLATRVATGLLCLTTISLLVPSTIETSAHITLQKRQILGLDRAISIVLIVVYFIYLWTQLRPSKYSYKPLIMLDEETAIPETLENLASDRVSVHRRTFAYPRMDPPLLSQTIDPPATSLDIRHLPDPTLPSSVWAKCAKALDLLKSVSWIRKAIPVVLMIVSTVLISISGELLVTSIDHVVDHSPISKTMVGLIILPIVGNAAEIISGIMFAHRKQLDLAFAVCIGSAMQIAVFVAPLVVLLGWAMGRDMGLQFTMFESVTLVTSTVLLVPLTFDDQCSSLKSTSLLAGYAVISIASYFVPNAD